MFSAKKVYKMSNMNGIQQNTSDKNRSTLTVEFFLTGQTRSDPIWPFFFAGRKWNNRSDRVWPFKKNTASDAAVKYVSRSHTVLCISRWL